MDADILTFGMAACIAVSILFCLRNPDEPTPREFRVGYRAARIEKLVLIAIARAHLTNRECSPSVQMLAFRCGMSESAARRDQDLEAGGHIETMKVPGKGKVYRVLLGVEVTA